ncbi:Protein of unknown function, partial [Gryllus bimaculatus]
VNLLHRFRIGLRCAALMFRSLLRVSAHCAPGTAAGERVVERSAGRAASPLPSDASPGAGGDGGLRPSPQPARRPAFVLLAGGSGGGGGAGGGGGELKLGEVTARERTGARHSGPKFKLCGRWGEMAAEGDNHYSPKLGRVRVAREILLYTQFHHLFAE